MNTVNDRSELIAEKMSVLDTLLAEMNPQVMTLLKGQARKDLIATQGNANPQFSKVLHDLVQKKINRGNSLF